MSIKDSWSQAQQRFEALSLRERGLIAGAAIGGALFLGSYVLVEPRLARAKALRTSVAQQQNDVANLRAELTVLQGRAKEDPDAVKKTELEALQTKLRGADQELAKMEGAFVPPERMNAVLEALLKRHPGLKLVSLRTLQPSGLLGNPAEQGDRPEKADQPAPNLPKPEFDLFRHGVEIQLEGSYGDLHAYLDQLEKGPQKFLWGPVRLTVVEYPKARLALVVYTLSSEKAWLTI